MTDMRIYTYFVAYHYLGANGVTGVQSGAVKMFFPPKTYEDVQRMGNAASEMSEVAMVRVTVTNFVLLYVEEYFDAASTEGILEVSKQPQLRVPKTSHPR